MTLFLPLPPATTPAERFANIIARMVQMLGGRLERPGKPGLAGLLTFAIHLRLQGIRNRINRYYARFKSGTLAPPRARPTKPRARAPRGPGKWDHLNLPKLPRERMWLVKLVPGIGVGANHLRILLDEPEMRDMLAMAPQIARTLRPFWHMLSPDPLPELLRKPQPPTLPPPSPGPSGAVDPLRGSPPQVGEGKADDGKIARPRPLSRLRGRAAKQIDAGVRVPKPPRPSDGAPSAPEVAAQGWSRPEIA